MFTPNFQVTPAITKALMQIEACKQVVDSLPLTLRMLDALRRTARLLSTHYSTQIEGNQLTPQQVEQVLAGGGPFPGRERDEIEVRNYHLALEYVEQSAVAKSILNERWIRTIHGLVLYGKKKPTPYRDGQNVIRDSQTGAIVYLPPEAADVPVLMKDLVVWIQQQIDQKEWPIPMIAAIAHYQFATIHPYYDGNGRSARLLTNWILHHCGYGLKGIYSLEEYYAKNLIGYYQALNVGPSHNYYFGRAEADITTFIYYFCIGMAEAFSNVRYRAEIEYQSESFDQSPLLRELTPQQRTVLTFFFRSRSIRSKELASYLQISIRSAAMLCSRWVEEKFLELANTSKKNRSYQLTSKYERLILQTFRKQ